MNVIEKITSEFLFFSFENLKYRNPILNKSIISYKILPLSKNWFVRISFLIRMNKISYTKFYSSNEQITVKSLKMSIIKNAFFLILKSYFGEYLSWTSFYFSEYLCTCDDY
jgi:hypothetical protein